MQNINEIMQAYQELLHLDKEIEIITAIASEAASDTIEMVLNFSALNLSKLEIEKAKQISAEVAQPAIEVMLPGNYVSMMFLQSPGDPHMQLLGKCSTYMQVRIKETSGLKILAVLLDEKRSRREEIFHLIEKFQLKTIVAAEKTINKI